MTHLGSSVSRLGKAATLRLQDGLEGDRRAVPHLWLCDQLWTDADEWDEQDAPEGRREKDVSAGQYRTWRTD